MIEKNRNIINFTSCLIDKIFEKIQMNEKLNHDEISDKNIKCSISLENASYFPENAV